jgi:hypothetical protein
MAHVCSRMPCASMGRTCHVCRWCGLMPPTEASWWRTSASSWAGTWRWSNAATPSPAAPLRSSRIAGWWKGPSHSAYNALLTSKPHPPKIGLTGLLNLRTVVTRLQAAQQNCACARQEAGAPCPSSPLNQSRGPALPPARESAPAQSVGAVAAGQSATTLAPARSSRRAAVKRHPAATSQPRGGRA